MIDVGNGHEELVAYTPKPNDAPIPGQRHGDASGALEIPEAAKPIGSPASLESIEDLFLAGQHLEQYRHATRDPELYYREALRRDPGDSRSNTALGRLLMRRGCPQEAEPMLRNAVERLTRHNPNPAEGEAHFLLGRCIIQQLDRTRFEAEDLRAREASAVAALWKSTWCNAWQESAFFELARLAAKGISDAPVPATPQQQGIDLARRCLEKNANHGRASHLLVALLFENGNIEEAERVGRQEIKRDPFNLGVLFELCSRGYEKWTVFEERSRMDWNSLSELAIDMRAAGLLKSARDVLEMWVRATNKSRSGSSAVLEHPSAAYVQATARDAEGLVRYHLASVLRELGDAEGANQQLKEAADVPAGAVFPNKTEDIAVLEEAARLNPADAVAPY